MACYLGRGLAHSEQMEVAGGRGNLSRACRGRADGDPPAWFHSSLWGWVQLGPSPLPSSLATTCASLREKCDVSAGNSSGSSSRSNHVACEYLPQWHWGYSEQDTRLHFNWRWGHREAPLNPSQQLFHRCPETLLSDPPLRT